MRFENGERACWLKKQGIACLPFLKTFLGDVKFQRREVVESKGQLVRLASRMLYFIQREILRRYNSSARIILQILSRAVKSTQH